jgi:hypothetical protein
VKPQRTRRLIGAILKVADVVDQYYEKQENNIRGQRVQGVGSSGFDSAAAQRMNVSPS